MIDVGWDPTVMNEKKKHATGGDKNIAEMQNISQ